MDLQAIITQWRKTNVPVRTGVRAVVEVARDASPELFPDEAAMAEVFAGCIVKHAAIPPHDHVRQEATLELGQQLAALLFGTFHGDRHAFIHVVEGTLVDVLTAQERAWQQEKRME